MTTLDTCQLFFMGDDPAPTLELKNGSGGVESCPFERRTNEERTCWSVDTNRPESGLLAFRIRLTNGNLIKPDHHDFFQTGLQQIWIQNGELFAYQPVKTIAPSWVIKIDEFSGRLSTRPLYVYLPRGYASHQQKSYPVLYMHDGQNVFQAFVQDSYAGSWRADEVADRLIKLGQIPECIIVGVSHGGENRLQEYLPPYSRIPIRNKRVKWVDGKAKRTADYYIKDVAKFVEENYRVKVGREHRATCGSSMGGLFSLYLAWERSAFANNHAVMSPSIWTTVNKDGKFEIIERLRQPAPPDVRLWIDSGTVGTNGEGDDGQVEAVLASEVLLENGFVDGGNLQHYLDRGADHSEVAWSNRLPRVLKYLFRFEAD